ncbi:MAG: hypothetical protein Kow00121_37710 [Elainellaceae cyanobacterium]
MTQIFTAFPDSHANKILCYYSNTTSHIQVIKIINIANFCFERVVFPGQRLFFEALADAQLAIFTGSVVSALLKDKIACKDLQVKQGVASTWLSKAARSKSISA